MPTCPKCSHNFKTLKREKVTPVLEQLLLLTTITWDGELINKNARDELIKFGYASKQNGYNFITSKGVLILDELGFLERK